MLRDMNLHEAMYILRRFVSALFLCILVSMVWFTANKFLLSKRVQPFQQLKVYDTSGNVEKEENWGTVTERERFTKKTKFGTSQNIWGKRAAELQEGCDLNRTRIAINRQNQQNIHVHASRLFVNDRYKFLYCEVPKAASTNILRILLVLDGKITEEKAIGLQMVHQTASTLLKHLNTYSNKDIEFRLNNYKKVIFVREPLERLVSAYRNRLEGKTNVTFAEFVQYLKHLSMKKTAFYDVHWKREFDLCFPCQVSYDIIGKYETLDQDMRLFLKEIGANDIKLEDRSLSYHKPKSSDVMFKYFKKVSAAQLKFLANFYFVDAVLYGYKFPAVF